MPETRSIHLNLAVAYSPHYLLLTPRDSNDDLFLPFHYQHMYLPFPSSNTLLKSELGELLLLPLELQYELVKYVISWSFWLRSGVNYCSFWRSVFSRTKFRIIRVLRCRDEL